MLADTRVFAGCERRLLSRVARWGDVIEAARGEVLVREDHTDFWFFVILAGTVRVSRKGRAIGTLGRGDHFGEMAIIGFHPQQATVEAVEPTVLFVLGSRYLLTLAGTDESVQRALFPDVAPGDYRTFEREQLNQAHVYWKRLRPRHESLTRRASEPGTDESPPVRRRPGRTLSWDEAIDLLSHEDLSRFPRPSVPPTTLQQTKRPTQVVATGVAIVLTVISLVYHPPIAVVSSGQPLDIVQDITITGVPAARPTGRYMLTPVTVGRPTLFGALVARIRGRRMVALAASSERDPDPATASRLAHESFLNSQKQAIALAEKTLHVDVARVRIVIRDRGITGPSAGLIYALAITDMLAPNDLAAGRVIAATGELQPDGTIGPVGFVSLKSSAAVHGGATLFLVPAAEAAEARTRGLTVIGVSSLADALRALIRTR